MDYTEQEIEIIEILIKGDMSISEYIDSAMDDLWMHTAAERRRATARIKTARELRKRLSSI